jgi:probable HAF family extracellular repeat protein
LFGASLSCAPESSSEPTALPSEAVSAAAVRYTYRDLGTLGGPRSEALDVNDLGAIVGWSNTSTPFHDHAVLWKDGTKKDLGTLGGRWSKANGINRDGIIVGSSETSTGAIRAVRWVNGAIRNLGALGGVESHATDINSLGWIVGWSDLKTPGQRRAFIWKNGVMTALGTLGGPTSSAHAISNGGVVVGSSRTARGQNHAFWWKDGVMHDMGNLGGEFSVALGVNTDRKIVGQIGPRPDDVGEERQWTRAFSWYRGTRTIIVDDTRAGSATDISPAGVVVGRNELTTTELEPRADAWVWEQGVLTLLPEPAPTGPNSTLSGANAINAGTHIVGYVERAELQSRAALWRRQ